MNKKLVLLALILSVFLPSRSWAQLIEEDTTLVDNTGALNASTDNTADISTEGGGAAAAGTMNGEITIFRTDSGVEVYSGQNKVEVIPTGSDGWVGSISDNGSDINFHPAGRPELNCPSEAVGSWFGPCKIKEEDA